MDHGNTVVVIEHNLDGRARDGHRPGTGGRSDKGGYIIAEGTPEHVVRAERSYTGQYLAHTLTGHEAVQLRR